MSFTQRNINTDNQLHAALDKVDLAQEGSVSKALDAMETALQDGANIHSTRTVENFGELTILQRAILLIHNIDYNHSLGKGNRFKQNAALADIIRFLIEKKADAITPPMLDFLLPVTDLAINNIVSHHTIMQLLFKLGAYQIDILKAKAIYKPCDNLPFQNLLSDIFLVKDVRDKIIGPLQKEYDRLEEKKIKIQYSSNPTDQEHAISYKKRQDIISVAIKALDTSLKEFYCGKITLEKCKKNIGNTIDFQLIKQSSSLNKYTDLQQLGRGLLNVLLTIATGFILVLTDAITGHGLLSIKGKTKEATQEACNNAKTILDRKFTL